MGLGTGQLCLHHGDEYTVNEDRYREDVEERKKCRRQRVLPGEGLTKKNDLCAVQVEVVSLNKRSCNVEGEKSERKRRQRYIGMRGRGLAAL